MKELLGISVFDGLAILVGRLLMAAIFLHESIVKLGAFDRAAAYAEAFGLPSVLVMIAIAVEMGCGLMLALGLFARAAALALTAFCLITAAIFHADFTQVNQLLHFEKNLAMAGGLLVLAINGPGPFSLASVLERRPETQLHPK